MEADIARARAQALGVERSASGAGADKLKRYAKKVAAKAKARERRLRRQMEAAEWIGDPTKAPSFTLSLDGVSVGGQRLAALRGVDVSFDGRVVLREVDLVVRGRDRIAITGENGAGKSTLLRLLTGELAPTAGTVEPADAPGVLPQDHHGLPLDRPVLDFYRSAVVGYEDEARAFLGHFLFDPEQLHRPIGTLSPGERSRLLIAMLVSSGAELLLLDEPTNHLDFDSLDVVEEALRQFRGTIVAVSHDRAFIDNIGCTRRIQVANGLLSESPSACTGSVPPPQRQPRWSSRPPRSTIQFKQLVVHPIPAAGVGPVEAVGVPQDRRRAARLGNPLQHHLGAGQAARRCQAQVARLGQGRVHHRQRQLDQAQRTVGGQVVGPVGMREAGPEARPIGEPLAGVVGEALAVELGQRLVRLVAQVVEAHAGHRPAGQPGQPLGLLAQQLGPLAGLIAWMQARPRRPARAPARRPPPAPARRPPGPRRPPGGCGRP